MRGPARNRTSRERQSARPPPPAFRAPCGALGGATNCLERRLVRRRSSIRRRRAVGRDVRRGGGTRGGGCRVRRHIRRGRLAATAEPVPTPETLPVDRSARGSCAAPETIEIGAGRDPARRADGTQETSLAANANDVGDTTAFLNELLFIRQQPREHREPKDARMAPRALPLSAPRRAQSDPGRDRGHVRP